MHFKCQKIKQFLIWRWLSQKSLSPEKNTFLNWNYQFSLHESVYEKSRKSLGNLKSDFRGHPATASEPGIPQGSAFFGLCPLVT